MNTFNGNNMHIILELRDVFWMKRYPCVALAFKVVVGYERGGNDLVRDWRCVVVHKPDGNGIVFACETVHGDDGSTSS